MSAPSTTPGLRLLAARIGGVAGSLAAAQVLVGLTYVAAARAITPSTLGVVATCFAIATIAEVVFDFGLTNFVLRESAAERLGRSHALALVRAKRRYAVVLTLPTLVVSLLLAPDPAVGVILGVVAPLVWEAASANSLLRGRELFSRAATGQLTGRAAGLAATVLLLGLDRAVLALPVGLAVGFAGEAVVDRLLLREARAPAASSRSLWAAQRASASFGLAALAAMGQFLDTPLVALGGGPADAGIYAGAGRLLGPLLFLSTALALVGLPWLARAGRDLVRLRSEERRIAGLAVVLSLAPLLAAAAGPPLIPRILGPQYMASGSVFAVLALGAFCSTINQGMAVVLQNRGAERSVARAVGLGLVLGLVVTYALAVSGGPVWAAVGYALSQLAMVVQLGVRVARTRSVLPPEPAGGTRPAGDDQ